MADRPTRSGATRRTSQGARRTTGSAQRTSGGATRRTQQQRRAPQRQKRQRSDLMSRVMVAIPAIIVAIVFVKAGGPAFAVLMVGLGGVCMHELYAMLERWRPVSIAGFLALAGLVTAAQFGSQRQVLLVGMAAVPVLFLFVVSQPRQGGATVTIAGTLLGVYWIGFAFAHAVLLRRLPHGGAFVIDVLIGTFLGDTAAYLGGRAFGRRPLAPTISPNKTVEGLFCGMLVAMLGVFSAALYQGWLSQGHALLLGLTVAVLGPIGDLFESLVKRDAGAKDAGTLFGAHGGALDRLDAVMFTIVAGYYVAFAFVG